MRWIGVDKRWCSKLFKDYLSIDADPASMPAEYVKSKVPTLLLAMKGIKDFKDDQFKRHIGFFYEAITNLILVQNPEVRTAVQEFFLRVGFLYNFNRSS